MLYCEQMGMNSGLHIIIFDEIDAICKARGSVAGSTAVHDTVVNQLLSKIDGVDQLNNILVIGQLAVALPPSYQLSWLFCTFYSLCLYRMSSFFSLHRVHLVPGYMQISPQMSTCVICLSCLSVTTTGPAKMSKTISQMHTAKGRRSQLA